MYIRKLTYKKGDVDCKEDWKDNLSCQAAFQRNEQGNDDR